MQHNYIINNKIINTRYTCDMPILTSLIKDGPLPFSNSEPPVLRKPLTPLMYPLDRIVKQSTKFGIFN